MQGPKVFLVAMILLAGQWKTAALGSEAPKVERVGGTYVVTSIERTNSNGFLVLFKSENPTGKFDTIRLESSHVHVGIKVGQKIRLSAEVISVSNNLAEASQILLFLPNGRGTVPVWMLSKRGAAGDLNAASYLEMHSPQADFFVL